MRDKITREKVWSCSSIHKKVFSQQLQRRSHRAHQVSEARTLHWTYGLSLFNRRYRWKFTVCLRCPVCLTHHTSHKACEAFEASALFCQGTSNKTHRTICNPTSNHLFVKTTHCCDQTLLSLLESNISDKTWEDQFAAPQKRSRAHHSEGSR